MCSFTPFFLFLFYLFIFVKLGASFHEWIKPGENKTFKKMMTRKEAQKVYVYLMVTLGAPFFKIGISKNPEERRSILQTGCPYPLLINETWKVTDNVTEAEKAAHKAMKTYSRATPTFKTEWFELSGGLTIDGVKEQLSKILRKYQEK